MVVMHGILVIGVEVCHFEGGCPRLLHRRDMRRVLNGRAGCGIGKCRNKCTSANLCAQCDNRECGMTIPLAPPSASMVIAFFPVLP